MTHAEPQEAFLERAVVYVGPLRTPWCRGSWNIVFTPVRDSLWGVLMVRILLSWHITWRPLFFGSYLMKN